MTFIIIMLTVAGGAMLSIQAAITASWAVTLAFFAAHF